MIAECRDDAEVRPGFHPSGDRRTCLIRTELRRPRVGGIGGRHRRNGHRLPPASLASIHTQIGGNDGEHALGVPRWNGAGDHPGLAAARIEIGRRPYPRVRRRRHREPALFLDVVAWRRQVQAIEPVDSSPLRAPPPTSPTWGTCATAGGWTGTPGWGSCRRGTRKRSGSSRRRCRRGSDGGSPCDT